jgi:cytochrome c-type biogenesis protein CcmH
MSLTLLGWLLIAASIALSAVLFLPLRSSGGFRGPKGALIVPAAAFLMVAGIGAVTSDVGDATHTRSRSSLSPSHSGPDADMLARLKDFGRTVGTSEPAPAAAPGKPLPDVNTMIDRLAARLETAPGDVKGWRMLGWSYFNTGRFDQAAAAYAKAVQLDPNSAELRQSYEEAKSKASEAAASGPAAPAGKSSEQPRVAANAKPEAAPPHQYDAAIRAMVDGLAHRLESAPQDVDGWARLMRSRMVLGEKEVAATTFRKALEVFKDDAAAKGKLTAAAIELGLRAQ